MDEPRQLDGDPSRKASWNRLLGNGKVDRLRNPGTPLGRSHFGRESLNGLERSKSAIGRPRGKYPGFLFKLLPRYLSRFMRQKGWGSARAPFYWEARGDDFYSWRQTDTPLDNVPATRDGQSHSSTGIEASILEHTSDEVQAKGANMGWGPSVSMITDA
jgi:hypothetical protein